MVLDEYYTPVKLRNEIIAEIDKIKENNPFLRTRPDVLKYVLHRYIEEHDLNGEGNGGNTSHLSTKQNKNGEDEKNV